MPTGIMDLTSERVTMTQTEETTRVDVPETLPLEARSAESAEGAATLPATEWRRLAKMAGRFGTVTVDGSAGTVTVTGGPSADWTYTLHAMTVPLNQGVATFAGPSLKALRAEVTGGAGTRPVAVSARGDYAVIGAATIPMAPGNFGCETPPGGTETATLVVSLDAFRTAVNAVLPAAMADMSRAPVLRCLAWRPLAGDIAATDSYRLHIGELRAIGDTSGLPADAAGWQLLVPADAISLVAGELKSSKSQTMLVTVHHSDGSPVGITFHGDRWTLYARLDTGQFPPWEKLVPPASDHNLIVRTDALEPALVAAAKFHAAVTLKKGHTTYPVRLTAGPGQYDVTLTITTDGRGEHVAVVPCETMTDGALPGAVLEQAGHGISYRAAAPAGIAFNPAYLLAAVRAVASGDDQGDAVTIATIDSGKPATISGKACTGTVRALLMPVRVN